MLAADVFWQARPQLRALLVRAAEQGVALCESYAHFEGKELRAALKALAPPSIAPDGGVQARVPTFRPGGLGLGQIKVLLMLVLQ